MTRKLTIGFVRRGFSSVGGAEAYLTRLAGGVAGAGHRVSLFTGSDWPERAWSFGPIIQVGGTSAISFADELERIPARRECDVLLSLERVWRCEVYRAGDGVHRAWLQKRNEIAGSLQKLSRLFNRKHSAALRLEESLFAKGGAQRVIANSRMVKDEIVRCYGYSAKQIDVVYNGVPLEPFGGDESRAQARAGLGLNDEDIAVLFAGSGWERKGLRFATAAVKAHAANLKLLVAGRGDPAKFRGSKARFLGVVADMASLYQAADIFLLPTVYDPFSNACLEALAAGLPVITTSANGFSEIIEPGRHGTVLDDPRNSRAMREALEFWADPVPRAQARIDNRALAAQFDISTKVSETLEIVRNVAQTAARAAST